MVRAVRAGRSVREVAASFGVSLGALTYWVAQARGKRLDRVSFTNRKPGRPWNRTLRRSRAAHPERTHESARAERAGRVRARRDRLGAARGRCLGAGSPGRTTIYRVLARHGVLDGVHRQRRPAPPKGWYLPDVAAGRAELDSFDFIEDLKIAAGPLVSVLTATSLHGGAARRLDHGASPCTRTLDALLERWRRDGLPAYAQFDNDTVFQGAHRLPTASDVSAGCVWHWEVIPVFAPPREPGFQNAIEGFNGLWQSKVWQRHHFPDVATLEAVSARYITAYRAKTAAPPRCSLPAGVRSRAASELDLNAPLRGTMIFLRRSNENGTVHLLGRAFRRRQALGSSTGALRGRLHSPAHPLLRPAST